MKKYSWFKKLAKILKVDVETLDLVFEVPAIRNQFKDANWDLQKVYDHNNRIYIDLQAYSKYMRK